MPRPEIVDPRGDFQPEIMSTKPRSPLPYLNPCDFRQMVEFYADAGIELKEATARQKYYRAEKGID